MTGTGSFAASLAGWTVCLPADASLEYLARVPLYAVPLAPAGVAGLIQLRGQPVVVFDAAQAPVRPGSVAPVLAGPMPAAPLAASAARLAVRDVLVVGGLPQAAGLLINAPPWPIPDARRCGQPLEEAGRVSTCPFREAIVSRCILTGDAGDQRGQDSRDSGREPESAASLAVSTEDWYEIDPQRLFRILSSN